MIFIYIVNILFSQVCNNNSRINILNNVRNQYQISGIYKLCLQSIFLLIC